MSNTRYVQLDRAPAIYFVREDVLKEVDEPLENPFLLIELCDFVFIELCDFVVEGDKLWKSRSSFSDMVSSYIQSSLQLDVISEARFKSEKIKEHYLEF